MATATKKKPAKKPKAKQQYLPTMEPPSIPELDRLADAYREVRDGRMRLTQDEADAADKLDIAMHEHGLEVYEYDGYVVRLARTEKVKVEKRKEPKPEKHTDA